VLVVDAQDRLGIGEQILFGQEIAYSFADHWRATHAAADENSKAELAVPRCASPRSQCRET
jgi:hypothetical protein